jgi:hypothetical protein
LVDQHGRTVDTTYQGGYEYAADAITPACGNVVLEIYSEKDPSTPTTYPVDAATVQRVWEDFDAFRREHPTPAPANQ